MIMTQSNFSLPEIDVGTAPIVNHISESAVLRQGGEHLLEQGYLIVRNAFDKDFIRQAYREYIEEYRKYFIDKTFSDALNVGNRRTMISLKFKGVFKESNFYANERIMPLIKFFLGNNCILNSLGSVVSLPGALEQGIHRDHPNIYVTETTKGEDISWFRKAPPYAFTMAIPLVPLNGLTGNTRFWPGSHLSNTDGIPRNIGPGVDFIADLGTCILFDYRIIHTGLANTSDQIRPLLYNIYSRAWFRDATNYIVQDPLTITPEMIRDVPKEHRHLFNWALSAEAANKLVNRNDPCICGSGKRYKSCHGRIDG